MLKKIIILVFFCAAAIGCFFYWIYSDRYASTDDGYVNANIVQIAPRVSGQVITLNVENNQFVKAGQLLFAIDQAPYTVAANQSRAEVEYAAAQLRNAQVTAKRVIELSTEKAVSAQARDDAVAKLQTSAAAVELANASLNQAELNLQYTHIIAPVSGNVTNMTLRQGDVVTQNQPLFALISNEKFWVDANYKETELKNVKPGQLATVVIDMYPDHIFNGIVESISGGSGAAFSLLPPQNATGNWVKVAQRIPVKVRILNPDPRYPLCVGTTATVTIDKHKHI